MTYQFAGVFVKPPIPQPALLPINAVWRPITTPFLGVGIRLPTLLGTTPDVASLVEIGHQLGVTGTTDWVYLPTIVGVAPSIWCMDLDCVKVGSSAR